MGWHRRCAVGAAAAALLGCGRINFDPDNAGPGDELALSPSRATINLGSKQVYTVSGGTPPYTWSLDGPGTLVEPTFIAPARAGETTVRVVDATSTQATATVQYGGEQLFLIGGEVAAVPTSEVLASSDGGMTWTTVGNLPEARSTGTAVVFDDRIFYIGGTLVTETDTVYVSSDGASWTLAGTLPAAINDHAATVHAGEIWIAGGRRNGDQAEVFHSSDGVTWTPAASFGQPRHEHDLVSRGDRLFLFGGHGTTLLDDIQYTTDGAQWQTSPSRLNLAIDYSGAGELGDLVLRTCGNGCTMTEVSRDLETWTLAAPLPGASRESPAVVGFQGRMLVIGGQLEVLASDDEGASWNPIGSIPVVRTLTSAVQFTPR